MPIELEITPEQHRNQIIRNCGAKPIGEHPSAHDAAITLSWFTDPITKSTLLLAVEDVAEANVRNKLHESRLKFGLAIVESALLNDIELIEQFKAFILSLIRKRQLPDAVVTAAANAAVMEIISFECAAEEEALEISEAINAA